jgi:hypothetical protein
MKTLMTFYHANGNIEYFDNEEDFSNNKERLYTEHCKEEKISFVLPRGFLMIISPILPRMIR